MGVQRYDVMPAVLAEPDGEYVRYEDYSKLRAVVEAAEAWKQWKYKDFTTIGGSREEMELVSTLDALEGGE